MTANHHPAPEANDPEFAGSSSNLLQIAWRRKALIVLGAVVGCVLGALYYSQQKPVYRSQASVMVIKKQDVLPVGPNDLYMGAFDDYLATHMVLLRSPLLVQQ